MRRASALAGPAGVVAAVLLLPLAALLVSSWVTGHALLAVRTESMEPAISAGSVVVTTPVDASMVEPGMVITFVDPLDPRRLVVHRVVRVLKSDDTPQFVTRGDANPSPDQLPVPARLVRGRLLWAVPALGTLGALVQWPRSFLLFVVVPALLLFAGELRQRVVVASAPHEGSGWWSPHAACQSCGRAGRRPPPPAPPPRTVRFDDARGSYRDRAG